MLNEYKRKCKRSQRFFDFNNFGNELEIISRSSYSTKLRENKGQNSSYFYRFMQLFSPSYKDRLFKHPKYIHINYTWSYRCFRYLSGSYDYGLKYKYI